MRTTLYYLVISIKRVFTKITTFCKCHKTHAIRPLANLPPPQKQPPTDKTLPFRARNGWGNIGRLPDSKVDICHTCGKLGHWAKDCDQPKEPVKEQAEVKSMSCQLVSPTRIYVTTHTDGQPIQFLQDSRYERSVIHSFIHFFSVIASCQTQLLQI